MRRALVIALLLVLAAAAPAAAAPELPNLYEGTPYNLGVEEYATPSGAAYHLGFGATVYNFGRGPLKIEGTRASTAEPQMNAAQLVQNSSGADKRYDNIGKMQYVDSKTHRHWHYLRFNIYELRGVDGKLVKPDQKTGFCLGDRVMAHEFETFPGQPPAAVFTGGCGYDEPGLLSVSEGISVNYADPYEPQIEGQFVDITGLPAGRYQLIHHVNADRALRESDYTDNAASVLVEISYPGGAGAAPKVDQLMRCDLSRRCPFAPEMTRRDAVSLAKRAFRLAYGARGVRAACTPSGTRAKCTGRWRRGSGSVTVAYGVSRGDLTFKYAATARGRRAARGRAVVPFERTPVPLQPAPAGKSAAKAYCPLIARG